MPDLEKRLLVCGIAEAAEAIETGRVGAVVTASTPVLEIEAGAHLAGPFLQSVRQAGIPRYQSRLFYPDPNQTDYSSFPSEPAPCLIIREAAATLEAARRFLADIQSEQKLMVHCIGGKDRSAMVALLLLYQETGSIIEALKTMQRLRPEATYQVPDNFFAAFGGDSADILQEVRTCALASHYLQVSKEMARHQHLPSIAALFLKRASATDEMRDLISANHARYGMDLSL